MWSKSRPYSMACSTLTQLSGSIVPKIADNPDLVPFLELSSVHRILFPWGCWVMVIMLPYSVSRVKIMIADALVPIHLHA